MLVGGGVLSRMGSIAAGTTASDYHDSERQRHISGHASLLHTEWMENKLNIIDTQGYLDFISEALGALRVGVFALVIVHGQHGVYVGTEQVWDYETRYGIAKVIVIIGLDKEEVDFDRVLAQVRGRFGERVFPLNLPINPGPGFNQTLDVLRNEIITYAPDRSGKFQEAPADGEWAD